MEIARNVQLKDHTSWQVGGPADYFCLPRTVDELFFAQNFALRESLPITLLGAGSNVLISDKGIRGLTICMRSLRGLESREHNGKLEIIAFAGTPKAEVMRVFTKHRLAPALFLAGLPGDIGGGIVMNAGVGDAVVPREFHEIVDWVEILRPGERQCVDRLSRNEIQWSYRKSSGWQPGTVVRAQVSWPLIEEKDLLEKLKAANRSRMQRQPLEWPSCGSVFKNPLPDKAGQLIDACQLKGFTIGGAQVSTKHANFIINVGGASASDVEQVIAHVQRVVRAKTGVQLQTEVVRLGDWT